MKQKATFCKGIEYGVLSRNGFKPLGYAELSTYFSYLFLKQNVHHYNLFIILEVL